MRTTKTVGPSESHQVSNTSGFRAKSLFKFYQSFGVIFIHDLIRYILWPLESSAYPSKIINKYEGTLAQVIGDGLYVFFGAPQKTNDKDHAIRCVKMAIEMQLKTKDLNKRWYKTGIDEELKIRCGINTGMATVGGYGSSERKEFTAMGMQVNIAARIESACKPGQIMMNHSSYVLIKDNFPCVEKGKIEIKGYHRPIKVYEVDLKKVKV